ncbi:MAG: thiamine phosphate synthase [Rikenellaceae bacterium]|jgi:thiamine-phosphate pyrophosphorylase|nr:thiamine phosphate synthase [Rikenellaceae bacterium]
MEDFGLYVILTRPRLGHERVAEICVEKGIKMLQLREKQMPDGELLRLACRLRAITAGTQTKLVINDRPDIAALCGADGLHLGQDDMPYEQARRNVGPDMAIGLSTHSLAQVRAAMALNPAYIGFGPVWPTPAKAVPDAAVGTAQLAEVLRTATVPVVAIGGIFPENVGEIIAAGARNMTLVRHLMDTDDLARRIEALQAALNVNKNLY